MRRVRLTLASLPVIRAAQSFIILLAVRQVGGLAAVGVWGAAMQVSGLLVLGDLRLGAPVRVRLSRAGPQSEEARQYAGTALALSGLLGLALGPIAAVLLLARFQSTDIEAPAVVAILLATSVALGSVSDLPNNVLRARNRHGTLAAGLLAGQIAGVLIALTTFLAPDELTYVCAASSLLVAAILPALWTVGGPSRAIVTSAFARPRRASIRIVASDGVANTMFGLGFILLEGVDLVVVSTLGSDVSAGLLASAALVPRMMRQVATMYLTPVEAQISAAVRDGSQRPEVDRVLARQVRRVALGAACALPLALIVTTIFTARPFSVELAISTAVYMASVVTGTVARFAIAFAEYRGDLARRAGSTIVAGVSCVAMIGGFTVAGVPWLAPVALCLAHILLGRLLRGGRG